MLFWWSFVGEFNNKIMINHKWVKIEFLEVDFLEILSGGGPPDPKNLTPKSPLLTVNHKSFF